MTDIGTLIIGFAVEHELLKQGMDRAERTVVNSLRSIENVGRSLSAKVTAPLALIGGFAVKLAADAEEAASKFATVLGPLESEFASFIAELQSSVPATRQELQGFVSTIQDLLVPLGILPDRAAGLTREIVKLAGDLASFNNLRLADVFRDLQSGLVGQFETLRKYGVALDANLVKQEAYRRGLAATGSELTAAAKAETAFALILERTTAAQGDAARTADSTANSFKFLVREIKELGTELGETLIPVIRPVVQGATEIVRAFRAMPDPLQAALISFTAFVGAIGPGLVAFAKLRTAIGFLTAQKAAGSFAALGALLGPTGLVVGGLVAAGAAMLTFARNAREAADNTSDLNANLKGLSYEQLLFRQEELRRSLESYRNTLAGLDEDGKALNRLRTNETLAELNRVNGAIQQLSQGLEIANAGPSVEDAVGKPADLTDIQRIMENFADRQEEITRNAVELGSAYDAVRQSAENVDQAISNIRAAGLVGDLPKELQEAKDIADGITFANAQIGLATLRDRLSLAGEKLNEIRLGVPDEIVPPSASDGVTDLGDRLQDISFALSDLDSQASGFLSRVGDIVSGISAGGFAGIAGAIGVGVGLIKGLFGEDEEAKRIAASNTAAVDRLTAGVAKLGTDVLRFSGDVFKSALDATNAFFRDFTFDSLSEPLQALEAAAIRSGTSIEELQRFARAMNIELDDSVDSVIAFTQALRANVLEQAFRSFNGQLDLMQAKFRVLGSSDADQFQGLLDSLIKATSGDLQASLGQITITNAEEAIAALLGDLPNFEFGDFGNVDPQALIQFLVQLDGLADAANGAAEALNAATAVLNAPQGFKAALLRFNASDPQAVFVGTQPGGTGGGITIHGDLVVQTDDPDKLSDQIDRKARRNSNRGGVTTLDLTTSGVRG